MTSLVSRTALVLLLAGLPSQGAAVEWDVSLWGERRTSTEHVHKLAELVAEKTGGAFTLNIVYDELSKSTENLDGISIGAFEMAQFCAGYHGDKTPTLTVLELPFLGSRTVEELKVASDAVYAHPATQDDLQRWNARLLMSSPSPPYNIVGTGEPRDSLDQFEGMRVRAPGGLGRALEVAGAVPTATSSAEAYAAMEAGVVDAVAFAPHGHLAFGTIELADWWTENLDLGALNCPVVVNIDAYEALSPAHRAALDGAVEEAMEHYLESYERLMADWGAILNENGVHPVTIPDAELARFRELAEPIAEKWIAEMSAQGLPGQELYDLVRNSLEEYRAGN